MAPIRLLMWSACFLICIISGSVSSSPLAEYVTSEDDSLGIRGYLLFHDYRFKFSSDFASELISTMMNYNVELSQLVRNYARDQAPENESYNEKNDECYRRLVESSWFQAIKPELISRLTAILTTLIEKDTKLATRADFCGKDNRGCVDHVTYHGRIEVSSYFSSELYNELKIKHEYLDRIKHEMDTCLNPDKSGVGDQDIR